MPKKKSRQIDGGINGARDEDKKSKDEILQEQRYWAVVAHAAYLSSLSSPSLGYFVSSLSSTSIDPVWLVVCCVVCRSV